MVFWIIGLVGTVAGIAGMAFLYTSITDLSGRMRKAMLNLFIAAGIYNLHQTLALIFGWAGLQTTHILWYLIPVLYFGAAVPFFIGMKELYHLAIAMKGGGR